MIIIEKSNKLYFRNRIILRRIVFTILLIATFYVIFNFSEQNGQESSSVSKRVTKIVVNIISKIKNWNENQKLQYIENLHPIMRKFAHFSIYSIVGFSCLGLFCTFNIKDRYKLIWTLVIGIVYASLDEIHQNFIPGRGPSMVDVGIDTCGVIFGMLIIILCINVTNKIENNKS